MVPRRTEPLPNLRRVDTDGPVLQLQQGEASIIPSLRELLDLLRGLENYSLHPPHVTCIDVTGYRGPGRD